MKINFVSTDWFTRLGLVKTITESLGLKLEKNDSEFDYSKKIAKALWEKFYKEDAPDWEISNNLIGVLCQIDNMIAGLKRDESKENVKRSKEVCEDQSE